MRPHGLSTAAATAGTLFIFAGTSRCGRARRFDIGLDASTSSIRVSCNVTSLAVGVNNTAPVALRTQRSALKRRNSAAEQSGLRRALLSRGATLAHRHRAAPRHSCTPRRPLSTARRCLLDWPASLRSHGRSVSPASVDTVNVHARQCNSGAGPHHFLIQAQHTRLGVRNAGKER